jgi:hypothetical protein
MTLKALAIISAFTIRLLQLQPSKNFTALQNR